MGPSNIPWASLALSHLRASQWPLSLSLKCISLDYLLVLILQLFLACCLTREAFSYLISKITTLLLLPSSLYYLSSSFIVHNTELHQTGSSSALFHCCTPALRDYALYIAGFQYIISQWMNEWIPIPYTSFISTGNSVTNKIVIAISSVQFSSVQSLSRVQLFATPWIAALQASLSITNSQSPPKPMSIELVMPFNHLILCCPLLLLPPIPPSIRFFSSESTLLMRWPKYWSFSFSISPSNEHPGLVSFRMDWLDLFAVQGTLKSLLQHHSSKASILWCSAFFTVQLSLPYMTTGKTIALTRQTFVGKVMSLLLNMLSRLVITFLPRSKCL